MSAHSHHIVDKLAEQLGGFEDQLRVSGTGAEVLAEIRESIGALITEDMDNEHVVRRMLQQHLEQGLLRKNSFRVAVSILDQTVSENTSSRLEAANAPDAAEPPSISTDKAVEPPPVTEDKAVQSRPIADEKPFDSTIVIPKEASADAKSGERLRPGVVLGERFVLDKVVAKTTAGTLYLAFDQQVEAIHRDETRVAVTILSPDITGNEQAVRSLQKITRRARQLAHPNIVHFNDLCRDGDVTFLVSEWINGRSLADILESGDARRIDRVAAFRIVRELGIGLDYAHRCGVVHADTKPGNIMIAPDGCARLIDSVSARAKLLRLRSQSDQAAASTTYASRQVLTGERLSASDDVFSLGCLLYRLLAGYRVFGPRNAAQAFAASMLPLRPEGISGPHWSAVEKALHHDREGRFESISEFMAALDEADEVANSGPRSISGAGKGRRQPVKWLMAGAVTSVLAITAAYFSGVLPTSALDNASPPSIESGAVDSDAKSRSATPGTVPRQTVLVSAAVQEPGGEVAITPESMAEETSAAPLQDEVFDTVASISSKPVIRVPELPVNAVGFADDHIVIYETDSAVQIDITRFNPDRQSFSIGYFVNDITATEGQDYFAPNSYSIPFGPGQDTARLLIPLVQDTVAEGSETFVIRLMENDIAPAVVEAQSIVVTIRDDGPQSP